MKPPTFFLSKANIFARPISTLAGAGIAGLSQATIGSGASLPQGSEEWIVFGLNAAILIISALLGRK